MPKELDEQNEKLASKKLSMDPRRRSKLFLAEIAVADRAVMACS